jgi:hypothetical protein
MSPTRSTPGSRTEIRLGARAHTISTTDRAHAPPRDPVVHHIEPADGLRRDPCTDKERGIAPTEVCPPEIRSVGPFSKKGRCR